MNFNLIGSVIAIGILALALGYGTYAYFSDTETSTGNSVTAGVLDLSAVKDGVVQITDMKPSYDKYSDDITLQFSENPGKLYKKLTGIVCTPGPANEPRDTYCAAEAQEVCADETDGMSACLEQAASDCINRKMIRETWFDLQRKEVTGAYTTLIPDKKVLVGALAEKYIYLGYYAPNANGVASVTIRQSFHLQNTVENWAQGQTCTFTEEFYLAQDNAPAPATCVNPAGMQGVNNVMTADTTCPGDIRGAPQFSNLGFTANLAAIPESPAGTFNLDADGSAGTTYNIQFAAGTTISPALKNQMFPMYLTSSTVPTATLNAYYASKPEPWKTYLLGAAAGTNAFAFIDGGTTQLADGAVYSLGASKVDMRIPGDYPAGSYTIQGVVTDTAGISNTVQFELVIS